MTEVAKCINNQIIEITPTSFFAHIQDTAVADGTCGAVRFLIDVNFGKYSTSGTAFHSKSYLPQFRLSSALPYCWLLMEPGHCQVWAELRALAEVGEGSSLIFFAEVREQ